MKKSIVVKNLSKQYYIGQIQRGLTFREALMGLVKNPFKKFKQNHDMIWALKNISFSVDKGEVVGIIGRNGAGKSTLLKVLSKITDATSGTVEISGRVAALLEVGTGFHEELTGRENIYLNGSILGMPKREIDAKLDAIVAFAGVEKFIDTPIKHYSSGMGLRLGFAVAAHLEPDILLIDEVLAVGDVEFQKKCLKAMDELRYGGRTVLFVSHNMAAIEHLCSRAIWIDNGQVQQEGDARDVIKAYLTTFAGEAQTRFDFRHLTSRRGSGLVRYTGLELLTRERQPKELLRSGDSLVIRLHYEAKATIPHPHFGLEIYSHLGTMVTSLNTWSTGFDLAALPPGAGYLDLELDFLNLMPSHYHFSLWLESVGPVYYDRLDHCASVNIETADFYGSGRGIDSRFGIVFFPCRWHLGVAQDRLSAC
jgi:lipopolysaccharide transport system ATP-binding protein